MNAPLSPEYGIVKVDRDDFIWAWRMGKSPRGIPLLPPAQMKRMVQEWEEWHQRKILSPLFHDKRSSDDVRVSLDGPWKLCAIDPHQKYKMRRRREKKTFFTPLFLKIRSGDAHFSYHLRQGSIKGFQPTVQPLCCLESIRPGSLRILSCSVFRRMKEVSQFYRDRSKCLFCEWKFYLGSYRLEIRMFELSQIELPTRLPFWQFSIGRPTVGAFMKGT